MTRFEKAENGDDDQHERDAATADSGDEQGERIVRRGRDAVNDEQRVDGPDDGVERHHADREDGEFDMDSNGETMYHAEPSLPEEHPSQYGEPEGRIEYHGRRPVEIPERKGGDFVHDAWVVVTTVPQPFEQVPVVFDLPPWSLPRSPWSSSSPCSFS